MPEIAFTTANYAARETEWSMRGWGHGATLDRHGLRVATRRRWSGPSRDGRSR